MIKKYKYGWITGKLFKKHMKNTVEMSQPMGRGLGLDKLRPGKVVLLAGGTGLYPFVDILDLLFKKTLLQFQLVPPATASRMYPIRLT